MTDNPNQTPQTPAEALPTGTVDITDLVAKMKSTWISWATKTICTASKALPGGWGVFFSFPLVARLTDFVVGKAVTVLANAMEMGGFFMNTAIRKASQAKDFVEAVDAKDALPTTASEDEYEAAEKRQMLAFRNFVMVSN